MQLHSDTHSFDDFSGQREKSLTIRLNSCLPEIKNNNINKLEVRMRPLVLMMSNDKLGVMINREEVYSIRACRCVADHHSGMVELVESTYPRVVIVGSAYSTPCMCKNPIT